jgi:hypothetical protein
VSIPTAFFVFSRHTGMDNDRATKKCETNKTLTLTAILVPTMLAIAIGIVLITTGKLVVEDQSQFWFVLMEIVGSVLLTAGTVTAAALMPVTIVNLQRC